MGPRQFTVTLDDFSEYKVTASYGVVFEYECFSCWTEIHSIVPISKNAKDTALTQERHSDIESALAYLIVDECEDLSTYEENRFSC